MSLFNILYRILNIIVVFIHFLKKQNGKKYLNIFYIQSDPLNIFIGSLWKMAKDIELKFV